MSIKAIVTDIEGTITSLSFVKEVLFPYSKKQMGAFVKSQHQTNLIVKQLIQNVFIEAGIEGSFKCSEEQTPEKAVQILNRWSEEDKKVTPLKALQGLIWEEGYLNGDYKGHLYPDAYKKLKELKEKGLPLYVYSSGSVKAQELLFQYSDYGDIRDFFSGFFDTQIGSKKETLSYRQIAKKIGLSPDEILFISDVEEELDAAAKAGFQTTYILREEDYPNSHKKESSHPIQPNLQKIGP